MKAIYSIYLLCIFIFISSCADEIDKVCEAGRQISCICLNNETGIQQCKDDSSGW